MSDFADESLTCLSPLDSVDIYAKNGAAVETDTSRRDQNWCTADAISSTWVRCSTDSRAMSVSVANICGTYWLSSHEKCLAPTYQAPLHCYFLYLSKLSTLEIKIVLMYRTLYWAL